MPSIQYQLDPEYVGTFNGGVIHIDDTRDYDIEAALTAGSGTITVVDTDLALINALDAYLPLHRSGTTGGPPGYVPPPALAFRRIRLGLGSATDETTLEIQHDADAYPRFAIDAEGDLFQGPGSTAPSPVALALSPIVSAPATSSGTLVANKHTPVDATAAPKTMALPTGQAAGARISVEKYDTSTNAVNITGNVRGLSAQTVTLALAREAIELIADAAGSWWPVAGHKTLSSLDSRYQVGSAALGFFDVKIRYGAKGDGATDDTAAIQAAITACAAAGGGTVYFPPGVYALSGAQQTGTAQSYNYSGQLLLPAQAFGTGKIVIRLLGCVPAPMVTWQIAPSEPLTASGSILKSSATSGNILDAIPSATLGGSPFTDVEFVTENLAWIAPNDPQCGAINAETCASFAARNTLVGVNANGDSITFQTGTKPGLKLPRNFNSAFVDLENVHVTGYPVGIDHAEHTTLKNVCVQYCQVGFRVTAAGGHLSSYLRAMAQECPIPLQAQNSGNGGGHIVGTLDIEGPTSGTWAWSAVIDDSGDRLSGDLKVLCTTARTKGWPVNGARELNHSNVYYGAVGWRHNYPVDTFTRVIDPTTNIGVCDQTNHPWTVQSGAWQISGAALKMTGSGRSAVTSRAFIRNSLGSRTIRATITTGTPTYQAGLLVGRNFINGRYLHVTLTGGLVNIVKWDGSADTTLASSSAGAVAAATTYDVAATLSHNINGTVTVTAYINGTQVATYTLSGAEVTALIDASTETRRADGIRMFSDTGSSVTRFAVVPSIA